MNDEQRLKKFYAEDKTTECNVESWVGSYNNKETSVGVRMCNLKCPLTVLCFRAGIVLFLGTSTSQVQVLATPLHIQLPDKVSMESN